MERKSANGRASSSNYASGFKGHSYYPLVEDAGPDPTKLPQAGSTYDDNSFSNHSVSTYSSFSSPVDHLGLYNNVITEVDSLSGDMNTLGFSETYHSNMPSKNTNYFQEAYNEGESCDSATFSQAKPTPKSLQWSSQGNIVEKYNFVVPGGPEPYFELKPGYNTSTLTPQRVYLDKKEGTQNKRFSCQYPGCVPKYGQKTVDFARQADLERHYRHIHAPPEVINTYHCDYAKCVRNQEPFTRKDHFRDHLRDYHKEDLGHAKVGKTGGKNTDEWKKKQEQWQQERCVNWRIWRCAKCLRKNYIKEHGWTCKSCQTSCEGERREARERMRAEEDTRTCSYCSNSGWYTNMAGIWEECPNCPPVPDLGMFKDMSSYSYD